MQIRVRVVLFGLLLGLAADVFAQTTLTPAQYLANLAKPRFAAGHHLPPLTRFGWQVSSNLNVEMATSWGYTLDLNWANYAIIDATNNGSMIAGFIRLASNNPTQYKLSVSVNRSFPAPIPAGFYCTNSAGQFVNVYGTGVVSGAVVSPEGPDNYWQAATEYWMRDLRALRSRAPLAVVLNAGEYGLDVAGSSSTAWGQDPRVQVATNGLTWARYSSLRKAHQIGFLTTAIKEALPDRQLYIWYNTGIESFRIGPEWQSNWGWDSDVMNTNTDLPSFECYYQGWIGHDFTNRNSVTGDLLTEYLNSVGFNYHLGYKTNYSWVCGGWSEGNPLGFADISRYTGFLKCLYAGGMVGGIAGYFTFPAGGFDASFASNSPPHWLLQIAALGQVHALFSHLEDYLFTGDLLPGTTPHWLSGDQPAYEFTNTLADATARVLVRKLRAGDQWLITAWAAAGADRNVTISIPTLGAVTVLARASGSVYQANRTRVSLIDINGMLPTASLLRLKGLRESVGSP